MRKKYIKKFLSIFSCIILSIVMFNVKVNAAQSEEMTIAIGESVVVGDNINVPIIVSNNIGVCGATLTVAYDDNLTLIDISKGTAFSTMTMTKPGDFSANPIKLLWDGVEADNTNGEIAILTFETPEKEGTYNITISYKDGDIIDNDINSVNPKIENGSIVVGTSTESDSCKLNGHKGGKATCTTKAICSVCGEEYGELDPENHVGETEVKNEKDATCQEYGYTGDVFCKECGNVVTKGENIPIKEHIIVIDKAEDATCTKEGLTEGCHCSVCNEVLVEQESIPKLEHDWSEEKVTISEPSCTVLGSKSFKCKSCGAIDENSVETIPMLEHSFSDWEEIESPNCVDHGSAQRVCDICKYTESKKVDALGHQWSEEMTVDQEPTCLNDGSKSVKCKVCGVVQEGKSEVIKALGHDFVDNICSRCGKQKVAVGTNFVQLGFSFTVLDANEDKEDCVSIKADPETDLNKECNIPREVVYDGIVYKVTVIEEQGFTDCKSITAIQIPDTITHIGDKAFMGCTSLQSITFNSEKAPTIGEDAFSDISKAVNVYVPKGAKKAYASLETVIIGAKIDDGSVHEHTWSSWKTTKLPTYLTTGLMKRTCKGCNKVESATIKKKCGTILKSVSNKSGKKVLLKWKKNKKVTGYQIQYSRTSSFAGAKTKTIKGASKAQYTLTKLKKGKTYYIRVRTYTKKNYSGWSSVKKVKINK